MYKFLFIMFHYCVHILYSIMCVFLLDEVIHTAGHLAKTLPHGLGCAAGAFLIVATLICMSIISCAYSLYYLRDYLDDRPIENKT